MATTVDVYRPFDSGAGANVTESGYRDMERHKIRDGALAAEGLELLPFADSTGRQVKVNTGKGFIRGHYFENNSTKTLAVTANSTGSTRIDRIVARLDAVNNRIELDVVAGTASAPALTQTATIWEISLGTVSVANGAGTLAASTVTDTRPWANVRPFIRAGNVAQLSLPASNVASAAATFDTLIGRGLRVDSSSRITIITAGLYRLVARIQRTGNNQGDYFLGVRKNAAGNSAGGTQLLYGFENNASAITAGYGRNVEAEDIVSLAAGDYLELFASQTSAGAVAVDAIVQLEWLSPA